MLTKERRQLAESLSQFYEKPVAKASVELFLSIGAVLFFAIFAIKPTLLTMSDLIKEIDDKRTLDQKLNEKIAALSTAQTEYLKIEPRLGILNFAIPINPDIVLTLKIIEKIASEQKIIISAINLSNVPKEFDATTDFVDLTRKNLDFTVSVSGDFPAIREFVNSLMQSRRSFLIEKIIFIVSDVRGVKRLEANISVSAPYYGLKP